MNHLIKILNWDSHFFEKKVCSILASLDNGDIVDAVFNALSQEKIDLAYYSSPDPVNGELSLPRSYSFEFVDKKITYKKHLEYHTGIQKKAVHPYSKATPEPKLLELALESGVFSRFKVDKNIGDDKFRDLYHTWMINSLNKKIAKEVLVYQPENEVQGFVTLGEKHSIADLGLLAIDSKFRGQGMGKTLIHSAENWFIEHTAFSDIQVVTQGSNIAACKFYENCGYHESKVEYTYHLWRKGSS